MVRVLSCLAALSAAAPGAVDPTPEEQALAAGHPRPSYAGVEDIDAMAAALRKAMVGRHSFSRSWWEWDRLRARYVDEGRVDGNLLKILRAVFLGRMLDSHAVLEAKGEGDRFYIFFTTTAGGDKTRRTLPDGTELIRDTHGGGYHGGWGGAARMRIYEELAARGMLTDEEKARFKKIVFQSMSPRFLDFEHGSQVPDNHSFGNAGGVALALELFPDCPQREAATAWLDRLWNRLAEYRDWREWTHFPYGAIFLHGMLDIAEATGRIETDRELIEALAARALGFFNGGGVRGNPNSGSRVRSDMAPLFADPWNQGYYAVEQSPRFGHFWYRLAQHYKDPVYLWAAEELALGGRPPEGIAAPIGYRDAYEKRFAWFVGRGIEPELPERTAGIGLLSAGANNIHERLFLATGREPGAPFAAFFLYDRKDAHLDNISGHLYEYSARGAKLLGSAGKYNNVYGGDELRGGGTGEESLDLLLVLHKRHPFPQHPDRKGDPEKDFLRRGSIRNLPALTLAALNAAGDAFAKFGFDDYYGKGSRWIRRAVLTREGYLVVLDEYRPAASLGDDYRAGPVWHLGRIEGQVRAEDDVIDNQVSAPAFDHAWWQTDWQRVLLHFHDDGATEFGQLVQNHSQDTQPNVTAHASRGIAGGRTQFFGSVLVPYSDGGVPPAVRTDLGEDGIFRVGIGRHAVILGPESWEVPRLR